MPRHGVGALAAHQSDEKLALVGVHARVGHTQQTRSIVLNHKILIGKGAAVYAATPRPVPSREVATLHHKLNATPQPYEQCVTYNVGNAAPQRTAAASQHACVYVGGCGLCVRGRAHGRGNTKVHVSRCAQGSPAVRNGAE